MDKRAPTTIVKGLDCYKNDRDIDSSWANNKEGCTKCSLLILAVSKYYQNRTYNYYKNHGVRSGIEKFNPLTTDTNSFVFLVGHMRFVLKGFRRSKRHETLTLIFLLSKFLILYLKFLQIFQPPRRLLSQALYIPLKTSKPYTLVSSKIRNKSLSF